MGLWSAPSADSPLHSFRTIEGFLNQDECDKIISAAEAAGMSKRGDYQGHITHDVNVLEVASLQPWLETCVVDRIFPLLAEAYEASNLTLETLRVVKYVGNSSCAGLPLHSDGTPLSFVCPLNCCAESGTYVRVLQRVVSPATGDALMFCGRWLHAGVPLLRDEAVRFVLTGFVEADFAPEVEAALERIVVHEQQASIAPRLCPLRRWLHREFAPAARAVSDSEAASLEGRACSSCGAAVPAEAVRHCCAVAGCCGTRWCDACLVAASAPSRPEMATVEALSGAAADEACACEFVADTTLADGALVAPGVALRKVWRLRLTGAVESADASRWPRVVRADNDCDERIGSRCLGADAFTLVRTEDDGDGKPPAVIIDTAVELVTPLHAGVYRCYFRLVLPESGRCRTLTGCDELFCEFFVRGADVADEHPRDWRAYQLKQRCRIGAALARSWGDAGEPPPEAVGTLVVAFAGADAHIPGAVEGGVPAHEFVRALRAVRADAAIFVRDVLRSWYLRGAGASGHDFAAMCEALRAEIDVVQPRRVVTLGCSMGGYAAVRAALLLRAAACVAFAPQVLIDPYARRQHQLPRMGFDDLLEALAAVGADEGFELCSLVSCVEAQADEVTPPPRLEIHVGAACPGDVAEARLLEAACRSRGVSMRCIVHDELGHGLAADLRATGELHHVLARLVQSDCTNEDGRVAAKCSQLPEAFVGFEGCDDF